MMSAITLDRAMTIAAAVRPETRAFIDGEYVRAKGGATFAAINPATGLPGARSTLGPGVAPRPKRTRKCC